MAKKYVWLKLKKDFLRQKNIKKLRKMPGGSDFVLIYLGMQLLSLENEGKLYFEGTEKDFAEQMALELDEDRDAVHMTLLFLEQHNLIEYGEEIDEFVLPEVIGSIGSETASAERVRKHREKIKMLQSNNNETQTLIDVTSSNANVISSKKVEKEKSIKSKISNGMLHCNNVVTNGNTEREKEREKEKDIEKEGEREKENSLTHSQSIKEKFSNLLLMIAQATKTTVHQVSLQINPMEIIDRLDDYIEAINQSEYLQGKSSTLPVIRNYTQMDKVLSGFYKTYDNKSNSKLDVNDVEFAERDDHIEF